MSFNFLSGFLPGNVLSKLRGEYINDEMREMVLQSGMFDEDYYFRKYPDVKNAGQGALQHYLSRGWKEGRNPSEEFDTFYYLRNNPDVIKLKTNPLVHYLLHGKAEKRNAIPPNPKPTPPRPTPEAREKQPSKPDVIEIEMNSIAGSGYFDEEYYLKEYNDLKANELNPVRHYCLFGWKEKRNPSEKFNTAFYLEKYPDVRKSEINPLLHYIKFGMAEGRKPLPELISENEVQNSDEKLLATEEAEKQDDVTLIRESGLFDEEYYLNENPDVKESGADPIEHYCEFGWKEGRNPSPDFNTVFYFQEYEDVKEGGDNPLLHYIKFGRGEGRKIVFAEIGGSEFDDITSPKNNQDIKEIQLIRESGLFDEAFYLKTYPDIKEAGIEPLEHYYYSGWIEGRNPSKNFITLDYLDFNSDVKQDRVNPLYHYAVAGLSEGRIARHPAHDYYSVIKSEFKKDKVLYKESGAPVDMENLSNDIRSFSPASKLIISLGHDNYLKYRGGIQSCVMQEQIVFNEQGHVYLNVFPDEVVYNLRNNSDWQGGLIFNGSHTGTISAKELFFFLEDIVTYFSASFLVIHTLLGHNITFLKELFSLNFVKSFLWLHDFFTICPGYRLLRNEVEFCNAPSVNSNACEICKYGFIRKKHIREVGNLFQNGNIDIIAPSEYALKLWAKKVSFNYNETHLIPHKQIKKRGKRSFGGIDYFNNNPLKVAFLGFPSYFKGWTYYAELAESLKADNRFRFYHFGRASGNHCDVITNLEVEYRQDDFNAMSRSLKEKDIHVVIMLSLCPETYSLTTIEAIAAGCFILAYKDSGNVTKLIEQYNSGNVFNSKTELLELFQSGEILVRYEDACKNGLYYSDIETNRLSYKLT